MKFYQGRSLLRNRKGFTIAETVVAIAIVGFLMIFGFQFYFDGLKSSKSSSTRLEAMSTSELLTKEIQTHWKAKQTQNYSCSGLRCTLTLNCTDWKRGAYTYKMVVKCRDKTKDVSLTDPVCGADKASYIETTISYGGKNHTQNFPTGHDNTLSMMFSMNVDHIKADIVINMAVYLGAGKTDQFKNTYSLKATSYSGNGVIFNP